jgi:hypothetical protein
MHVQVDQPRDDPFALRIQMDISVFIDPEIASRSAFFRPRALIPVKADFFDDSIFDHQIAVRLDFIFWIND